jgi:DNA polymerase (family 10)
VPGALPTNREVAARLELMADLLELEGAVRHRVMAYRRAGARIRETPEGVAAMALAGRAVELRDIGATLQAKIAELATTGDIAALARLRDRVPEGLAAVARLRGVGPTRAGALWRELGVRGLDDLRAALDSGRARALRGFGPELEHEISVQLAAAASGAPDAGRRISLGRALPLAEWLLEDLSDAPAAAAVAIAGEVRRGVDEVEAIELAAASERPEELAEALASHPAMAEGLEAPDGAAAALAHLGVRIELHTAAPAAFGALLQRRTGSAAHTAELGARAAALGLRLVQEGLAGPDGGIRRFADEESLYAALGLAPIPPELREGRGEVEAAAAGPLPALVAESDLVGDLHVHTDWSDGRDALETMVAAARERGYGYVAISDHSQARGLSPDRVRRQWEAIDELNARGVGIRVLKAIELDILADGRLDFEDDLLVGFDFVTASVHSGFRQPRERLTSRMLAAIESPHVDAIGHPTGRKLGRRAPYPLDLELLMERAAATGTFLEVNSQPARLDLDDRLARMALEAGVRLTIGSDAHSAGELGFLRYGALLARRAGAGPQDIATTRSWEELRALLGDRPSG